MRAGNKAGGAHAQKSETPVEKSENQGAKRYRAYRLGSGQAADHRGIDRANQRHRNIRDDNRAGKRPDFTMTDRICRHHLGLLYRVLRRALKGKAGSRLPGWLAPRRKACVYPGYHHDGV